VSGVEPAVNYCAWDTETGAVDGVWRGRAGCVACKLFDQFFETGKITGCITLSGDNLKFAAAFVVSDEM
jgi:hypothetical protein